MKKFLPKSIKNTSGFTLVELLVVVAIIAVLAVIGFAVFSGLTSRGNDARRRADLKSIADAMEVAKENNANYQPVENNDFTGGVPPQDPSRTSVVNKPKYCYKDGITAIDNPSSWSAADCPDITWAVVDNINLPSVSITATFFKVCGMTDDLLTSPAVICFGSRQ